LERELINVLSSCIYIFITEEELRNYTKESSMKVLTERWFYVSLSLLKWLILYLFIAWINVHEMHTVSQIIK
jgi:hypothetical protein